MTGGLTSFRALGSSLETLSASLRYATIFPFYARNKQAAGGIVVMLRRRNSSMLRTFLMTSAIGKKKVGSPQEQVSNAFDHWSIPQGTPS